MSRLTEAQIQENIRRLRKQQEEHIKEYGFTVMNIFAGEDGSPAYAYTIGNFRLDWPEILLIGNLGQRAPMMMIHAVIDAWRQAGRPSAGDIKVEGLNIPCVRMKVVAPHVAQQRYTKQVRHFKGDENYTVMQLLWPDDQGHFPDEPGYNPKFVQPILPHIHPIN
jgi:hypothetical protein